VMFSLAAAGAFTGPLVACGGGGGAAPAPTPAPVPIPAPTPSTPIAAQLTVPTPVGYDVDRLAAFNRLNEIRLSAGLGMVAQNTMMDQAAQAHAEWMVANDQFTHDEAQGSTGFTGENYAQRAEYFGYIPVGGGEVISSGARGDTGVDALVNMPYHRSVLLAIEPVDVGIGWSGGHATNVVTPLVIDAAIPGSDVGRRGGQAPQSSISGAVVWPISGARGVPLRLGHEIPNPIPTQDVLTLGTPVSVSVEKFKTVSATQFTVTNSATGTTVPTQLLTNQNDANFLIPETFIAAIPLAPLAPNTTYRVDFSGSTITFPSGVAESVIRTWSFTTATQ